jgi:sugar/nucleoside kinase (ribokinase family)
VAIVRAGGQARFYGAVGPDGAWVKERMGAYGIDVEGILVSDVGFIRVLLLICYGAQLNDLLYVL